MKKAVIAAYFFIAAGVMVAAGIYFNKEPEAVSPLVFLPANTSVLIRVVSPALQLKELENSRFGKSVLQIQVEDLLTELGAAPSRLESFKSFKQDLVQVKNSLFFRQMLGEEALVAFIHPGALKFAHTPGDMRAGLISGTVFMSRPGRGFDLARAAGQYLKQIPEMNHSPYRGVNILRFKLNSGYSVYLSYMDGHVLASFFPGSMKSLIDTRRDGNGIGEQERFMKARSALPDHYASFMYLDLARWRDPARVGMELVWNRSRGLYHMVDACVGSYASVSAVASASARGSSQSWHSTSVRVLNGDNKSRCERKNFTEMSPDDRISQIVPPKSMIYFRRSDMDLYCFLKSGIPEEEEEFFASGFNLAFGIRPEHLARFFGREAAVAVLGYQNGGLIPVPDMAIILKLRDRQQVIDLIREKISGYTTSSVVPFRIAGEQFRGVQIDSLRLPFGDDISPCIAVAGDMLVIGMNVSLVKRMVSVWRDGGGMEEDKLFNGENLPFVERGAYYLDFAGIREFSMEMFQWMGGRMGITDPEAAHRVNVILKKIVFPVLEGLSGVSHATGRSGISGDLLITKGVVTLEESGFD